MIINKLKKVSIAIFCCTILYSEIKCVENEEERSTITLSQYNNKYNQENLIPVDKKIHFQSEKTYNFSSHFNFINGTEKLMKKGFRLVIDHSMQVVLLGMYINLIALEAKSLSETSHESTVCPVISNVSSICKGGAATLFLSKKFLEWTNTEPTFREWLMSFIFEDRERKEKKALIDQLGSVSEGLKVITAILTIANWAC